MSGKSESGKGRKRVEAEERWEKRENWARDSDSVTVHRGLTRFISLSTVSATQLKTSQWQGSHLPFHRVEEWRIDSTKRKAENEMDKTI